MKALRIDHVALAVRNMDDAIRDFCARFGLELISDTLQQGGNIRMVYLAAGDTMLQLISPLAAGPFRDFIEARGEGLHHICFEVEALPDAASVAATAPAVGGMGALVCFLTKPVGGATIELTEPRPSAVQGERT